MSGDFVKDLKSALGDRIRADGCPRRHHDWAQPRPQYSMGQKVYAALSNIIWVYKDGGEVSVTFRQAGAIVAELFGDGDYMDWYCSACEGVVDPEVEKAMAEYGWSWKEWPDD